jgi:hypothetical protein
MKRVFLSLLVFFLLSCSSSTSYPVLKPTNTSQPTPTEIPQTLKTGYLKTSLEVVRNGKTYDVVIGYDAGSGWRYDAPELDYPKWFDSSPQAQGVMLHWAGDVDLDGELEFFVQIYNCGAYCTGAIQVYDYDPVIDEYRLFDEFYGKSPIKEYKDIDSDGNPEMISGDEEFERVVGATATLAFSPIMVYRYERGEMMVVTKEFPELIQKDAEHWLDGSRTNAWDQGYGFLPLASYLYDMYLLDKSDEGVRVFNEICATYVKPAMSNPDWNCDKYLLDVQELILRFQSSK